MKRLYSLIILLHTCTLLFAQGGLSNLPTSKANDPMTVSPSSNQNYILTTTYMTSAGSSTTVGAASPEIQYFDGLGRPIENVGVKSSQNGNDIISMQTYDAFGNPEKSYLPYSKSGTTSGAFVAGSSFITEQNTFLSALYGSTDGSKGYSIVEYEKSPLNRVAKQGAPGADWQLTRPVKTNYKTNSSSDPVTYWIFNIYGDVQGYTNLSDGKLFLTETIDEDNKVTRKYTDLEGRVVQSEIDGLKTRYCYDLFGRLKSVLMPSATGPNSNYRDTYQYKYDQRGRMTDKKMPIIGSNPDFIYYIYDSRDRLVLTQDPHQRNPSIQQWSYIIYDGFNRPVEEGTWTSTTDRAVLASSVDSNIDYMSTQTSRIALKKSYYSGYSNTPSANTLNASDATDLGVVQAPNNNGRLTGENVKLLDNESDMPQWLFRAYYYDKYGRLIQTVADNHLGGKDVITNKYNFTGQVIQTRTRHTVGTVIHVLNQYFDYDHRGRLMKIRQQLDQEAEVLIAANSYNEAGNLATKYLHQVANGNFLQKTDYSYNIRNWLTAINDPVTFNENDKFGMQLQYNVVTSPGAAQYNGNIAAMIWGTPAKPNLRYDFSYDNKNRLINSVFSKTGYPTGSYNEDMSYDVNGNIVNLNRYDYGTHAIDKLVMNYTGCVLGSVKDNCTYFQQNRVPNYYNNNLSWSFGYYLNGNLTLDDSRSLVIDYNVKSLPRTFTYTKTMGKISNFYTFNGEKLRKNYEQYGAVTKVDYCGPFVYNTADGIRSLAYIITPEGRAVANGTSWDYEYNLTDHLGNVRSVIKPGDNNVATVVQERHYYPSGLEIGDFSSGSSTNKYLYNSKELYKEFQLYWYDYGARYYDAALARWNSPDPLAESYYSQSPYHFAGNNPMLFLDANGMDYWSTNDPNEIARFLNGMQSGQGGFKSFDYKGWSHVTDAEFTGNLTYNDQTNMFHSSYGTVQNDEATRVGISISGIVNSDTGNAGFLSEAGASWLGKSSGRMEEPLIDPIDIVAGGLGSLKTLFTRGFARGAAEPLGQLALGTARDNLLNKIKDPMLRQIVNDLYRPGAKLGSGSAMDAFRIEGSHLIKIKEYQKPLQKLWLKRDNLSQEEKQIVSRLLTDIKDALNGK